MASQSGSSVSWTPIIIVAIGIAGLYFLSSQKGNPQSEYTSSGQPASIGAGIAQGSSNLLSYTGAGAGIGAAAYGIGKSGLWGQITGTFGDIGSSIGNTLKNIFGNIGGGSGGAAVSGGGSAVADVGEAIANDLSHLP